MPGILAKIFRPNDGSRKQVAAAVVTSRKHVEYEASRLKETIRELMDTNDRLTGRLPYNAIRKSDT